MRSTTKAPARPSPAMAPGLRVVLGEVGEVDAKSLGVAESVESDALSVESGAPLVTEVTGPCVLGRDKVVAGGDEELVDDWEVAAACARRMEEVGVDALSVPPVEVDVQWDGDEDTTFIGPELGIKEEGVDEDDD